MTRAEAARMAELEMRVDLLTDRVAGLFQFMREAREAAGLPAGCGETRTAGPGTPDRPRHLRALLA